MEPKGYVALFAVVAFAFAFVYTTYTIPAQAALGAIPYFVDARVRVAHFVYGGITVVAALLALFAYKASRPLVGAGRRVIEYFALALAFYALGAAATTIGLAFFIITGMSFNLTTWHGLVYPCCIPVAMMFSGIAPYFMLKFGHWMAEQKDPGIKREATVLTPLSILLVAMTLPTNWFGAYAPRFSLLDMQLKAGVLGALDPLPELSIQLHPDVRLLANGLLLFVNLVALIQIIVFLRRRIVSETEHLKAARLRTVLFGFLAMLGFFACYTLDALMGGGYTVPLFVGFVFGITALILLYIGVAAPKWYTSWIQKRAKS
ncbi:MAG: hypothetical protein QXK94_08245 [Candidatus Jordarchaeales archaeon]